MRKILVIGLSLVVLGMAEDAETVHMVEDSKIYVEQLSKLAMQERLRSTAKAYEQYGSVARVAHFDLAYPKDKAEYLRMNGFGILWITAHSQIKEELPLKNVRIYFGEKDGMALDQVTAFSSIEQDPKVTKVLGQYRSDALYLIPLAKEVQGATLVTDYAINREEFKLGTIVENFPKELGSPIALDSIKRYPEQKDFDAMLEREYPIIEALAKLTGKAP